VSSPSSASLSGVYGILHKFGSSLYAARDSSYPEELGAEGSSMLDIIYLALGLGLFALMVVYARWAATL
jgi:hypothetical protein